MRRIQDPIKIRHHLPFLVGKRRFCGEIVNEDLQSVCLTTEEDLWLQVDITAHEEHFRTSQFLYCWESALGRFGYSEGVDRLTTHSNQCV